MVFDRSDFPMLHQHVNGAPLVYLDSASTALKPQAVIDAIGTFYSSEYGTVHRAAYQLSTRSTSHYLAVREQLKHYLNAESADEIVFTKGTTEAINLVAFSFGEAFLSPGDEVIISGMEHHSNIVPWQLLCKRKKAYLKVIPLLEDGTLDLNQYRKLISSRTKMVSVAHISNLLGVINPLSNVIEIAHSAGAKVFIDGAQSAPHLAIDVQALDCDFFAFSGHKIYGPTGVGVLYGKKELLCQMPPYQGGSDMIQELSFQETVFQPPPLKFEAGTPMIAEVIGLGAALTYLCHHRFDQIAAYETRLIEAAMEQLLSLDNITILGPLKGKTSLITFVIEGVHPLDMASLLDARGVALRSGDFCAQPLLRHFGLQTALRLSVAPYNTQEEISYLSETLKEMTSILSIPK